MSPTVRRQLPTRRAHRTPKVRIAGRRTLSLAVHDDPQPTAVFLRVNGADVTPEPVAWSDVLARTMSVALRMGVFLAKVADLLLGVKVELCGPVTGHARSRYCTSLPDLIGRHLLGACGGRTDLAPRQAAVRQSPGEEGEAGQNYEGGFWHGEGRGTRSAG